MYLHKINFSLFVFVFVFSYFTFAQMTNNNNFIDITSSVETGVSDKSFNIHEKSYSDLTKIKFKKTNNKEIKFSYSPDKIWLKVEILNNEDTAKEKYIYFDSTLTGELKMYQLDLNQKFQLIETKGSSVVVDNQRNKDEFHRPAFKVIINKGKNEFVFERQSIHRLDTRVFIAEKEKIIEIEDSLEHLFFFYFGAIVLLSTYNLVLFFFTKSKVYLLYSIFVLAFMMMTLVMRGFFDHLINLNYFTWSQKLLFFSSFASMMAHIFSIYFLNLHQNKSPCFYISRVMIFMFGMLMIFSISPWHQEWGWIAGYIVDTLIFTTVLLLIVMGVFAFKRKEPSAVFYLIGWSFIFLSTFAWLGMYLGFVPKNFFVENAFLFASLIEMLTLSLGLAFQINVLKNENKLAEDKIKEGDRYHRLVKVLVHDMANSLMPISLSVRALENQNLEENSIKQILRIKKSLNNTINNLQSVRAEEILKSYQAHIELEKINLKNIVDRAIDLVELQASQKGIKINNFLTNNDFGVAEETSLLNQVLLNIFNNAIKYSFEGSNINIKGQRVSETCIQLQIQDFGQGMNQERVENLFSDTFIGSKVGTSKELGSGIGLKLVKSYMDLYGGKVWAKSVEKKCADLAENNISTQEQQHGTTIFIELKSEY